MRDLEGKVAIVTGAARGIGRATAAELIKRGASVALFDVAGAVDGLVYETASEPDMDRTIEELRTLAGPDEAVISVCGDVRDQGSVDELISRAETELGPIAVAVINHGVLDLGTYWEMDASSWQRVVDINLVGAWRVAKAVTPLMIERRAGKIIMVASSTAIRPLPKTSSYIASKAGIFGLVKAMAADVSRYNVNVNAVAPGATDTPINDHPAAWDMAAGGSGGTPEDRVRRAADIPLPREKLLDPKSMAYAIAFLASPQADDITGIVLPVDGGRSSAP